MIAERFGQLEPVHPFFPRVEHVPQVSVIETMRGNAPLGSYWHTDLTWKIAIESFVITPNIFQA